MRVRLLAAFAAVYIIWGSTYLAIRFAVETLPPLLMAGVRFLIAGSILLLWVRLRQGMVPERAEWRTGFVSGALLLVGGNGAVVWAEQYVPSGIAALLVAVVPVWVVMLEWLRPGGQRPRTLVFAGIALGLAGLALLVGPSLLQSGEAIDPVGAGALILGALSWAVGSLYTRGAPKARSGLLGSGTQMLAAGACLVVIGMVFGEIPRLDLAHASLRSLLAVLYLILIGSIVGYTAYLYLLAHTTAAKAATYAYVNPLVAVLLGWLFANEPINARTLVAAAVILAGVAIITVSKSAAAPAVESKTRRAAA